MIFTFFWIPNSLHYFIYKFQKSSKKVLMLQVRGESSRYIFLKLPKDLNIRPVNFKGLTFFIVYTLKSKKNLCFFWRALIQKQLIYLLKGHVLTIMISGFNYRIDILSNNVLQFALGKSHLLYYQIPSNIFLVECNKKDLNLTFFSYDQKKLNDFGECLRQIQPPNVYSQKGIFLAGEKRKKKKNVTK